jgi:hypothetical protein
MARTVYCRWCYNQGHNRRTCPEYTERLKERAEAEVENNKNRDDDNQGTYSQIDYANRIKADTLLDGTPHEREKQGNGTGTRRCSYCASKGHNRRTCKKFGVAKQDYLKDAIKYRKDISKTIAKQGIGIGSLITIEPRHGSWDEDRNYLYMVVGFDWDIITHRTGIDGYRAIQLKSLDADFEGNPYRNEQIPFPKPYNHKDDPDVQDWQQQYANSDKYWEKITVVSKIPTKTIEAIVPSGWYDKKNNIEKSDYFKNYFKDARHSEYWDNYYD